MDQDYSTRFYSLLAPAYDWVFGKTMDGGRRAAAQRVRSGQTVLEVGTGTGLGYRHYPSGCHVVGVDICPRMLRRARWRALVSSNGSRFEVRKMDATRLAYDDESFDVVIAPYVVTTVGEPERLCAEMARVCRPGGTVMVVSNTRERGLYGALKSGLSPLMEKVGFSTDLDVGELIAASGLRIVEERRVNGYAVHKLFVAEKAADPSPRPGR